MTFNQKVVIVQDYLRCGGTEHQSIAIGEYLKSQGATVTLLTFRPGGRIQHRIKTIDRTSLQAFDSHLNWWAPSLVSRLQSLEPDIVLLMGRNANCQGHAIQKAIPSAKVVTTHRTGRKLPSKYIRSIESSDLTICNSHFVTKNLPVTPQKLEVIHNSLLHSFPNKNPKIHEDFRNSLGIANKDTTVLLKTAAFVPGKNHKDIIDIVQSLEGINAQLLLLGEGPTLPEIKAYVSSKNLDNKIQFCGYQSDVTPYYLAADIAVSASLEESLPNFVVEAQAAGLPVVAYDTAGTSECFDPNKSGILVEQGNKTEFKNSLLRLIQNPSLRDSMSQQAQIYAESHFSPVKCGNAYIHLFSQL